MSSTATEDQASSTVVPPRLCSIYARDVATLLKRPQLAACRLVSAHWDCLVDGLASADKLPRYSLELEIGRVWVGDPFERLTGAIPLELLMEAGALVYCLSLQLQYAHAYATNLFQRAIIFPPDVGQLLQWL